MAEANARRVPHALALLACTAVGGAMAPGVDADVDAGAVPLAVIVCDAARVPPETLSTARQAASKVFAQAGVEVIWLGCSSDTVADAKDVEREIACHRPRRTDRLVLEILPHADAGATHGRDVGGFARVSSGGPDADCAGVFYRRAAELAPLGDASTGQLLAHLIAHEIGHLLLGEGAHSQGGIMRPAWSRRDVARAAWGKLAFEPAQAERLRAAALARKHR